MECAINLFFHGKSLIIPCCFLEHNCAGNMTIWLSLSKIELTLRISLLFFPPATSTGTTNGARPGSSAKNEFTITLTLPLHFSPMTFSIVRPSIPPSGWLQTKHNREFSSILRFSSPIILTLMPKNFSEALTKSKPTLSFPSVARNSFNSSWWMSFSRILTTALGKLFPVFFLDNLPNVDLKYRFYHCILIFVF